MKTAKVFVLLAVVALAAPMVNAADGKNSIGLFVNYLWPTGDYKGPNFVESNGMVELDSTMGYGLGYRYMLDEKWDFGASLFYAQHDVNGSFAGLGSGKVGTVSWMPLLFDANWHFGKNGMIYLGPTIGYAMWNDIEVTGGDTIKIKDQFVFGLNLGFDIPFGKAWAFNGNVRYLGASAETDEPANNITIDVKPWLAGVGISYRF